MESLKDYSSRMGHKGVLTDQDVNRYKRYKIVQKVKSYSQGAVNFARNLVATPARVGYKVERKLRGVMPK